MLSRTLIVPLIFALAGLALSAPITDGTEGDNDGAKDGGGPTGSPVVAAAPEDSAGTTDGTDSSKELAAGAVDSTDAPDQCVCVCLLQKDTPC
uniref:Uncharacterized protein n=1 Tax=Hucho hucho TaxID=62062 RepID=A0A4W5MZ48_9TELE